MTMQIDVNVARYLDDPADGTYKTYLVITSDGKTQPLIQWPREFDTNVAREIIARIRVGNTKRKERT